MQSESNGPLGVCLLAWLFATVSCNALPPEPLSYSSVGCYIDGSSSNRDLLGLQNVVSFGPYNTDSGASTFVLKMAPGELLTLELCSRICSYGRFRYFGAQSQGYCSCDSTYGSLGPAPASDCSYPCYGNSSQICGGSSRNSIYENFYSPIGPKMTKLSIASMPSFIVSTGTPSHESVLATSDIECVAACHRSTDCLVCAFAESKRMCRLMRFFAVPSEVASEVASESQWVWVK